MRSKRGHAIAANGDGSFPAVTMSSNASRTSRTSRGSTSVRSRGSSVSSSYYRQYNNNNSSQDFPRPMCGQAALNKIISPVKKTNDNKGLLDTTANTNYEQMPLDSTPMDNIYSPSATKFSQNFVDPEPSEAMLYIPQFNVNKAKQVQAKKPPPPAAQSRHRRLSSVAEAAREDGETERDGNDSDDDSSDDDERPMTPSHRARTPPPKSVKDRRIEQMIRSMQEIIMQQEENLNALGSQNAQYRENMSLFQDHVLNLKKEQVDQRNEILKLQYERESYEAEALSLREELKTMRDELARAKSERNTSWSSGRGNTSASPVQAVPLSPERAKSPSPKTTAPWLNQGNASSTRGNSPSSPSAAASWMKHGTVSSPSSAKNTDTSWIQKNSSPRQGEAPWTKKEEELVEKETKPRHSPKHKLSSSPKRQSSVSFHETVQQRDDAPSDMRWERSRQRSVFNKDNDRDTLQAPVEETREASPRHSPSPSGKCSDLAELQARANELRDTVARMKLDSPSKQSDHMRYSSRKSAKEASYDERKRDAVLRYSRGERGTSYWNSHDMQ